MRSGQHRQEGNADARRRVQPDLAVAQAKQILRKPCDPERLVSVVERYVEAAA